MFKSLKILDSVDVLSLIDSLYDKDFKVIVGAGNYGSGELNCPFV